MFVNICNTVFVDIIPLCPHDEEKLEHVVIFRGWNTVSKYIVNHHLTLAFSQKFLFSMHTSGTNTPIVDFAQILIFLKSTPHICGLKNVLYGCTENEKTLFFEGSAIGWKFFAIITHPNIIVSILQFFEKVAVF